jgi:biopolymer transport protein ExbD
MNLQPGGEDEPEVNLTPLIDVVFLLLIFFMVSAETEDETLEIVIDSQGRYFIGERQVVNSEVKTLKSAISKAVDGRESLTVIIRSDASTPYQAVITALDATSQLGLTQISLATSAIEEN